MTLQWNPGHGRAYLDRETEDRYSAEGGHPRLRSFQRVSDNVAGLEWISAETLQSCRGSACRVLYLLISATYAGAKAPLYYVELLLHTHTPSDANKQYLVN